jgi:hypothetical protein
MDTCGNAISITGGFHIEDASPPEILRVPETTAVGINALDGGNRKRRTGGALAAVNAWIESHGNAQVHDASSLSDAPLTWSYANTGVYDGCALVLMFCVHRVRRMRSHD